MNKCGQISISNLVNQNFMMPVMYPRFVSLAADNTVIIRGGKYILRFTMFKLTEKCFSPAKLLIGFYAPERIGC